MSKYDLIFQHDSVIRCPIFSRAFSGLARISEDRFLADVECLLFPGVRIDGKIAGVLKRREDREEYNMLQKEIRSFWNRTFVEKETGCTLTIDGEPCDTQCSYALALAYGIVDDTARMAGHLARKVRENGHKVGTGFFGTGLLNKALSRNGYREDAWKMLLQTEFPSWLYPVTCCSSRN